MTSSTFFDSGMPKLFYLLLVKPSDDAGSQSLSRGRYTIEAVDYPDVNQGIIPLLIRSPVREVKFDFPLTITIRTGAC